jgi:hypothetical protein
MVKVDIDRGDLTRLKATMAAIGKSANPVMARAINKTLMGTRTDAVGEIYKSLNLTKTRIRKDFSLHKASSTLVRGSVLAKGEPIGLASFSGTKQLKSGYVSFKVHRKEPTTKLRHAFMAPGRGGSLAYGTDLHVWERLDWGKRPFRPGFPYAGLPHKYRFPLERLTGPRIEDDYSQKLIIDPVSIMAANRLTKNVDSQIDYEWSKLP